MTITNKSLLRYAAAIVASYLAGHAVRAEDVPTLIRTVYQAIRDLQLPEVSGLTPSVPIRESVFRDYLICLEDGRSFQSLKRHLAQVHDMKPEQYRARWGLPSNYPMTAPVYSEARVRIAKETGLGRRRT